jgi:hypothetical protein
MIRAVIRAAAAAWVVSGLAGCGTFENLSGDGHGPASSEVYGGVGRSLVHCRDIFGGFRTPAGESCPSVLGGGSESGKSLDRAFQLCVLGPLLLGVDLPLCAVADTLTLPVTVPAAWERSLAQSDTEPPLDPSSPWQGLWKDRPNQPAR